MEELALFIVRLISSCGMQCGGRRRFLRALIIREHSSSTYMDLYIKIEIRERNHRTATLET